MPADRGFDRALDRSVVLGYSSLGYAIRRRSWPLADPASTALTGKRALVTGAGGGVGEATALGLARLGAQVHLLARSAQRAAPALARIEQALHRDRLPARLEVEECDVADLSSVREFVAEFSRRLPESTGLDVVVHNAGVMPSKRSESVDGHELTIATHVLGPILMTELLRPLLQRASTGARVVLVSSGGMYTQALAVDDPEFVRGTYRGAVAYARSKRMQVELTPVLAQRWAVNDVSVYAMHPGWVNTPGIGTSLPLFRRVTRPILRTPTAGADTCVWLAATEPAAQTGTFWHDRHQRPTSYRGGTVPSAAQVAHAWEWTRTALALD